MRLGVRGLVAGALTLATLGLGGGVAQAQSPAVTVGADGKTDAGLRLHAGDPRAGVHPGREHRHGQRRHGRPDRDRHRPPEGELGPTVKVPAIIDPSPYYTSNGRGNEGQRIITATPDGDAGPLPAVLRQLLRPARLRVHRRAVARHRVPDAAASTTAARPTSPASRPSSTGSTAASRATRPSTARRAEEVGASGTTAPRAMIGKSYDGTFANGIAATGVEGLKTIVPISRDLRLVQRTRAPRGVRHNTTTRAASRTASPASTTELGPARRRETPTGRRHALQAFCGHRSATTRTCSTATVTRTATSTSSGATATTTRTRPRSRRPCSSSTASRTTTSAWTRSACGGTR